MPNVLCSSRSESSLYAYYQELNNVIFIKIEEKTVLYGLFKSITSRILYWLIWDSISLNTVMQNMR
jgi:hypothetical protein